MMTMEKLEREERAWEYIDKVERRRARDEARAERRWLQMADKLWDLALGAMAGFVLLSVLVTLTGI